MSSIPTTNEHAVRAASGGKVDTKLEVVVIPVSDVDRAKRFYGSLGWRLDADFAFDNGFRVIQFTPPGSWCSVQFGTKMTSAAPGTISGRILRSSLHALTQRDTQTGTSAHAPPVLHGTLGVHWRAASMWSAASWAASSEVLPRSRATIYAAYHPDQWCFGALAS